MSKITRKWEKVRREKNVDVDNNNKANYHVKNDNVNNIIVCREWNNMKNADKEKEKKENKRK